MPIIVSVYAYLRIHSCLPFFPFMPIFFLKGCILFSLRSCLEFIPAFYKECFRGFLFVLMRSIAGYVTNKNGEKDRKQI